MKYELGEGQHIEVHVQGWFFKVFVGLMLAGAADSCSTRFGGPDPVDAAKGTGRVLWNMLKSAYDGASDFFSDQTGNVQGGTAVIPSATGGDSGPTAVVIYAAATPTPIDCTIKVTSGQTLSGIADDSSINPSGLSVVQLAKNSGIANPNNLYTGQCIDASPPGATPTPASK